MKIDPIECRNKPGQTFTQTVNHLGENTPKKIAVRELNQNSIESCKRKKENNEDFRGKVEIFSHKGNFAIKDNGTGMTPAEMKLHFSNLFNSTHISTNNDFYDDNKGIGAKISLLPYTDLQLFSKTEDGKSFCCEIVYDEKQKVFGHKLFEPEDEDEELSQFRDLTPEEELFFNKEESGFAVVLTGRKSKNNQGKTWDQLCKECSEKDGTKDYKEGTGLSILKFLNTRYYEMPDFMEPIKVSYRKQGVHSQYFQTTPIKDTLEQHCKNKNTFNSTFCFPVGNDEKLEIIGNVAWHIIDDEDRKTLSNRHLITGGSIYINYKNECFGNFLDYVSTKSAHFRKLGIYAGSRNIIVEIKLLNEDLIKTNANRTGLLSLRGDGESSEIILEKILNYLANNVPEEIQEYVKENLNNESDDPEKLQDLVDKFAKELRLRHRPPNALTKSPRNTEKVETAGGIEDDDPDSPPEQKIESSGSGGSGGKDPNKPKKPKKLSVKWRINNGKAPKIEWCDFDDENKIAEWHPEQYKMLGNTESYYLKEILLEKRLKEEKDKFGKRVDDRVKSELSKNFYEIIYYHYQDDRLSREQRNEKIEKNLAEYVYLNEETIKSVVKNLKYGDSNKKEKMVND
jgi:hypothetical protein